MFISMMFAGHHTTSGTAAWTLIELLRHPDVLAGGRGRARRALRRRRGGELPGAAGDAPAGGGDQGGAAAAPAAHPGAAGGQGGDRGRGLRDRRGQAGRGEPGGVNRIAEDFPDPDAFVPGATSSRARRTGSTRGRGSPSAPAGTAASGAAFAMMQLKAIFSVLLAGLGLRAGPAARHLPQRPLQDGRAARAALRGRATGAGPGRRRVP